MCGVLGEPALPAFSRVFFLFTVSSSCGDRKAYPNTACSESPPSFSRNHRKTSSALLGLYGLWRNWLEDAFFDQLLAGAQTYRVEADCALDGVEDVAVQRMEAV